MYIIIRGVIDCHALHKKYRGDNLVETQNFIHPHSLGAGVESQHSVSHSDPRDQVEYCGSCSVCLGCSRIAYPFLRANHTVAGDFCTVLVLDNVGVAAAQVAVRGATEIERASANNSECGRRKT